MMLILENIRLFYRTHSTRNHLILTSSTTWRLGNSTWPLSGCCRLKYSWDRSSVVNGFSASKNADVSGYGFLMILSLPPALLCCSVLASFHLQGLFWEAKLTSSAANLSNSSIEGVCVQKFASISSETTSSRSKFRNSIDVEFGYMLFGSLRSTGYS